MGESPEWLDRYGETRLRRRGRRQTRLALALVLLTAVAGLTAVAHNALGDHGWRPPKGVQQFASCTYRGYVAARCGRIAVPENPARPHGQTISLRVAVIPATKQPAAGALFYLEGGPGGAATNTAVRVNEIFGKALAERDVVLVDQRGTGGSNRLACPHTRVSPGDATAVAVYLRRCLARFPSARLYTTAAAADDLEVVRRRLGYRRVDVYGSSYGATLAQVYLRRHPQSVRTLMLDAASLLTARVYESSAANADRALRVLFARCAAERTCEAIDPRRDLRVLLARPPRRVQVPDHAPFVLRPDDVARTIEALSADPDTAAQIPLVMHEAVDGDYRRLTLQFLAQVGAGLDGRSRLAMLWTILCNERWAGFDVAETAHRAAGSYLAHAAVARARFFRAVCRAVPRARDTVSQAPDHPSHTPVLLLAGGADPRDPVANLAGWKRTFPSGRLIVVAGAGHGVIAAGCLPLVAARFLSAGTARALDTRCASAYRPPPFDHA